MDPPPACDYISVDIGGNPITPMERTIDYYAELKTGDAEISGREYKMTGTLREIQASDIYENAWELAHLEILYSPPLSDFVYDKIRTGYRPLVDNPLLRDRPGVYYKRRSV